MFPRLRTYIHNNIEWLNKEPFLKDKPYQEADAWLKEFAKHLDEDGKPDEKVADMIYGHAMTELGELSSSLESLTSKASDHLKLIMTIIGAFLALWRYAASTDTGANHILIVSNVLAASAICCLVLSAIILTKCLRGMPWIPTPSTRNLLEWYQGRADAAYIKIRAAARIHRAIQGNRETNQWLHERSDVAWKWTIAGVAILTLSIVARLFA